MFSLCSHSDKNTWQCFVFPDINNNSDPVSSRCERDLVFPVPQCTVTQGKGEQAFWKGLGESLPCTLGGPDSLLVGGLSDKKYRTSSILFAKSGNPSFRSKN